MRITAFDLGTISGGCYGDTASADMPTSEEFRLRLPSEPLEIAAERMGKRIRDLCFIESLRPDLIAYEAAMPIFDSSDERERGIRRSPESIDLPRQLIGAIHGVAACYGIRCERVWTATARKHFTGKGHWGGSKNTKIVVRDRAVLLKYVPAGCTQYNRTDAICIWDFAAAMWGRRAPKSLVMFEEEAFAS